MYYIGLDVHKKTISCLVEDGGGHIHAEGTIPATRLDLVMGMKALPQPWTAAMEVTIFTAWIYNHLLRTQPQRRWHMFFDDSMRTKFLSIQPQK